MAAFLVMLTAAGCRGSGATHNDLQVHTSIAPQPVRVGESSVTVEVADALQKPVTGAQIQVEGDMAHPGMAPVFGDANETAPGTYSAQLHFNMPGDWVVLLHIRLADGRKVERQIDVRGVAGR
ncbi:MAG: FixH family protein [Acidobacteriaceae bacterium]